jgi:hypothetical protein
MTSEKPDHYDVEPHKPAGGSGGLSPDFPADMQQSGELKPLPVEPASTPARARPVANRVAESRPIALDRPAVKDLDVCPNCGASMRGTDTLVCLRCGFDLKTMKVVKTVTGEVAPESEAEQEKGPPLVEPGMGDLWLPGAMAVISGALLMICYLAGAHGLFPSTAEGTPADIGPALRFQYLLRFIIFSAMGAACGLGALAFLANMLGMRLVEHISDLKLAAVRMLGIVVTARLAALIDFPSQTLEWITEIVIQIAAFAGLSIVLFRLNPRDALTLAGAAVILFVLLWLGAYMVVWSAG